MLRQQFQGVLDLKYPKMAERILAMPGISYLEKEVDLWVCYASPGYWFPDLECPTCIASNLKEILYYARTATNKRRQVSEDEYQFLLEAMAKKYRKRVGLRLGQFYYNEFARYIPSFSVPDHVDCFQDDSKLEAFLNYVYDHYVSQP